MSTDAIRADMWERISCALELAEMRMQSHLADAKDALDADCLEEVQTAQRLVNALQAGEVIDLEEEAEQRALQEKHDREEARWFPREYERELYRELR